MESHRINNYFQLHQGSRLNLQEIDKDERRKWLKGSTSERRRSTGEHWENIREHRGSMGEQRESISTKRALAGEQSGEALVSAYPRDNFFPDFGFTLTGLPSAIACGLNAGIDVGNVKIVPVEGDDNGKPLTPGSEPSQSTDGQGGAWVKPPDKATNHFKPLAQTDYLCLIHANDQPFCLPPGTYHRQSGLGFEIKDVDSLTLPGFPGPSDWGLKTHWRWENQDHQRQTRYDGNEYKVNQDPTKKSPEWSKFEKDMKQMDMNESGESTFTVEGPGDGPDPVCCLFSDTSFGGNVWCVVVGGGDALPQWKDVAQSVSCHAGAQVTLYAKVYGDCGGAVIKGNVEDLKNEPFGNQKETFSKNVKALWVANGA